MKITKGNISIELVNHCRMERTRNGWVAHPKPDEWAMPGGSVMNLDQLIKFCETSGAQLS